MAGEGGVPVLEAEAEVEEVQEVVVGVSSQAFWRNWLTSELLKGGRGGGGSRGRGGGGTTFKKSGPDDPRIGSSVQIFVEGLPQVHPIAFSHFQEEQ